MIADVIARVRAGTLAALAAATLAVSGCMASHDVITGAWTLVEVNGSSPAAEASISLLPDGTFVLEFGGRGSGPAQLSGPMGVDVAPDGRACHPRPRATA